MQITGIILAGGKSTRMGRDKALIEVEGTSLLDRSVKTLQAVCDNLLISSANESHARPGIDIIKDEVKDCGPIGGVYSCLKKSVTDWNFVVSVDSPFVEPGFIKHLLKNVDDCDVLVPQHHKGKEPLVAFYHKNSISQIEDHLKNGIYKMHRLLDALNTKYIDVQDWVETNPRLFFNYNRPEDF